MLLNAWVHHVKQGPSDIVSYICIRIVCSSCLTQLVCFCCHQCCYAKFFYLHVYKKSLQEKAFLLTFVSWSRNILDQVVVVLILVLLTRMCYYLLSAGGVLSSNYGRAKTAICFSSSKLLLPNISSFVLFLFL